jgi:glycosyl transferase family 87
MATSSNTLYLARQRAGKPLLAIVLSLLVLRAGFAVASPAGFKWDFINFYNTGARVFHGESENIYKPKTQVAGHQPHGYPDTRMHYVGLPISTVVLAPFGALEPRPALVAFKAACALSFAVGIFVLIHGVAGRTAPRWRSPLGAAILASFVLLFAAPLWFVFDAGGQATAFAFLLLALFAHTYIRGRDWMAALCLSFAILLKPVLVPAGLVFLAAREWRFIFTLGAAFVASGLASILIFGWALHVEWFNTIRMVGSTRVADLWPNNAAVLGIASNFAVYLGIAKLTNTNFVSIPPMLMLVQTAFRVMVVVLMVVLAYRTSRRKLDQASRREDIVLIATTIPLLIPALLWPHYLSFLFVPIAVVLARWDSLPPMVKAFTVLFGIAMIRGDRRLNLFLDRLITINTITEILVIGLFAAGPMLIASLVAIGITSRAPALAASPATEAAESAAA